MLIVSDVGLIYSKSYTSYSNKMVLYISSSLLLFEYICNLRPSDFNLMVSKSGHTRKSGAALPRPAWSVPVDQ